MEILTVCFKCQEQKGYPADIKYVKVKDFGDEIDSYYAEGVCQKGHKTITWIQSFRFEFLFDYALKRYTKQDYNTAVIFFATAVERFYWFCTKVFLHTLNPDIDTSLIYKPLKNNSESQRAVYQTLFAIVLGEEPVIFNSDIQKYRNDIIHKGQITEKEIAREFGQEALRVITTVYDKLKNNISDFFQKEINYRLSALRVKYEEFNNVETGVTTSETAIFSISENIAKDFDVYEKAYQEKLDEKDEMKSAINKFNEFFSLINKEE